jgi:MFS family permease
LGFWLPTIVKDFGVSDLQTGFITAAPYAVGAIAVVIWPLLSDRMRERKWNTALAFLVAAGGLALSTYFPDPVQKMIVLSIGAIGMFAIAPLFWTLPTAFLTSRFKCRKTGRESPRTRGRCECSRCASSR